ncbi:MAG: NAD(P)H-dependent flavin oxidoreductase [Lautropia sp.]
MKTLRTDLCELLGIRVPILQAGMGLVAYGELAAAVSNAGGLGSIGAIDIPPDELEEEIRLFRRFSDKPLCVDLGFPTHAPKGLSDVKLPQVLPGPIRQLSKELEALGVAVMASPDQAISRADNERKLEIALAHGVEVIACALGTPQWVVEACHAQGAKVMSIVGLAKHAKSALRSGTDVIIVQGTEGGGHTGEIGLLTLLAEVLAFSTVPVVAAGGIVTGRQIAGCLVQGASGVWMGTRFVATQESRAVANHKAAIVEAADDTTLRSGIFDGLPMRQLRNRFTDAWDGHYDELSPYPLQRVLMANIRYTADQHNIKSHMNLPSGQGAGLVSDIPPAAEVLARLVDETVAALEAARARIRTAS